MKVVVIGGGIAGVSAAAMLSSDADVTLIEAEEALGYHASGRSAALFEENYGNAAVRALNRASRARHEAAGVLSPRGLLMVAMAGEEAAFETDLDGMGLEEVPVDEARRRVPILGDVVRAAVHEDALDIDTDKLIQSYAAEARRNGTRIVLGERVTEIDPGREVRTTGGAYGADIVVDAAGSWADQIAALAGVAPLGLQPCRRSVARIAAPGGHDVSRWPILFGPGETWYAKPDAGCLIVSPADEDPMEPMDAWADDMVLAEGLARYEARVTVPVTRPIANWAGLRTFAPDRALVIGEGAPGFFWLAGQGGYGFQSAPAAAQLLADLVLGRTPELAPDVVAALSPERFR